MYCSAGVAEGKGTASVLGGPDLWRRLQATHDVRTIANGTPPELAEDIEFAVFAEGLGLFAEVTTHLKRYGAIVLADFGFARTEKEELNLANPLTVLMMQVSHSFL